HAVHGRRYLRIRPLVSHHAHHGGDRRQRAPVRHLRPAPGHARDVDRDPARQAPSAGRRLRPRRPHHDAGVGIPLRGLAGGQRPLLLRRLHGLRADVAVAGADLLRHLEHRRRGGAEDRAVQHPADPAERVRLPGAQHAHRGAVDHAALPRHALHHRQPGHLPARRGAARAAARADPAGTVRRRAPLPGAADAGGTGMIDRVRRSISNILAVAYREALVLRHDKGFLATVISQPIMMLLLFGGALSYTPADVPWAVLDRSASAESRRFVEDVFSTGYFLAPRTVGSYAEGRELLRREDVLALVVIPKDFRRDIERSRPEVQLLVDGSDPITAARLLAYIGQVAATFEVGRPAPDRFGEQSGAPIDVRQRFWFNPTLRDRNFFLAVLAGMLLTNLCLSISALNIVGERESGTFEQTLSLPTSTLEIVLGKLLPLVMVGYVLLTMAIVGSGIVFGVWPQGSWLGLVVVTLPFVLAS